jgi:hypothetical protein
VTTFVDLDPSDPTVDNRKEAVEQVLLKAAESQEKLNSIGRLAGHWLVTDNRDHNGVLLAGTVRAIDREGPFYITRIVLFGLPKVITVLSSSRAALEPQDRVLIAGSIIERPSGNIAGYTGNLPRVVWGGRPVLLPSNSR